MFEHFVTLMFNKQKNTNTFVYIGVYQNVFRQMALHMYYIYKNIQILSYKSRSRIQIGTCVFAILCALLNTLRRYILVQCTCTTLVFLIIVRVRLFFLGKNRTPTLLLDTLRLLNLDFLFHDVLQYTNVTALDK